MNAEQRPNPESEQQASSDQVREESGRSREEENRIGEATPWVTGPPPPQPHYREAEDGEIFMVPNADLEPTEPIIKEAIRRQQERKQERKRKGNS
ncbi:hypothetical protein BRC19_03765 [Candidatus Saccharibacteria bacterium QS_5_54_17]|nr:MAG: hypothetical protein BRC19_03765 [Candidatus Saccharibacteria bacterium QS_5_54_17]